MFMHIFMWFKFNPCGSTSEHLCLLQNLQEKHIFLYFFFSIAFKIPTSWGTIHFWLMRNDGNTHASPWESIYFLNLITCHGGKKIIIFACIGGWFEVSRAFTHLLSSVATAPAERCAIGYLACRNWIARYNTHCF